MSAAATAANVNFPAGGNFRTGHPRRGGSWPQDTSGQARPASSSSSRWPNHQFTSAPKTITFAIT